VLSDVSEMSDGKVKDIPLLGRSGLALHYGCISNAPTSHAVPCGRVTPCTAV
jgi:hypothetical protein